MGKFTEGEQKDSLPHIDIVAVDEISGDLLVIAPNVFVRDARLVAAEPDLLAAAERVADGLNLHSSHSLRRAIQKAREGS